MTTIKPWKHLKPPSEGAIPEELIYPCYASPKLDGIRASCQNGQFTSNTGKRLPNDYIQSHYDSRMDYLDGELVVGDPTHPEVFRKTSSGVMSKGGEPNFTYYVFDYYGSGDYESRYMNLRNHLPNWIRVALIDQRLINNVEEMLAYEEEMLNLGYEGVIARSLDTGYKNGRATKKQNIIFKIKRFVDDEGVLIGFAEQMQNNNEATVSELGYTKRSSHKANKSGKGTAGKFIIQHPTFGELPIGSGTAKDHELQEYWDNQEKYIGKTIVFKYFPIGMKDKPRMPIFKGFRDKMDIGE